MIVIVVLKSFIDEFLILLKNFLSDANLVVSVGALIVTVVSVIVAVKALGIASQTLEKTEEIAANQMWTDLISEYSSPEFGEALKAISDFYIDDCNRELGKVKDAYKQRCDADFCKNTGIPVSKTLKFQRRMVGYFYWKLDLFIEEHKKYKKYLSQYFTKGERNMIAVIYKMNEVDNCFRKLTNENEEYIGLVSSDKENQILSHLSHIYSVIGGLKK